METDRRYLEIDLLRTIAIFLMLLYHLAYDLAFFYGAPMHVWEGGWLILQRITANLFLLLVGVSFAISYGRMEAKGASRRAIILKYLQRGVFVFLCGMLVTLVTYIFDPGTYVRFGILHLIGIGIMVLPFVMPLREWNVILAVIAWMIGRIVHGLTTSTSLFLPLGIVPHGFVSVDYFPVFPWVAAMLIGTAIGHTLYNRRCMWHEAGRDASPTRPYDNVHGWLRWHVTDTRWTRVITAPGRHALVIYLVHQPLLLASLWMAHRW